MMRDERGVSIAITHALTLGITAVLLTSLLLSAGSLLTEQEERAGQQQFEEVGGDLVSHINSLDELNETGTQTNVSLETKYPRLVAGEQWSVEFSGNPNPNFGTNYSLSLNTPLLDRTIQYPIQLNSADLDLNAEAQGGDITLRLCEGTITFGECP